MSCYKKDSSKTEEFFLSGRNLLLWRMLFLPLLECSSLIINAGHINSTIKYLQAKVALQVLAWVFQDEVALPHLELAPKRKRSEFNLIINDSSSKSELWFSLRSNQARPNPQLLLQVFGAPICCTAYYPFTANVSIPNPGKI